MKALLGLFLALAIAAGAFSGPAYAHYRVHGHDGRAVHGAVVGGVAGAAIGGIVSKSVGGALVGGAIGAVGGYIVGKHSYRCWRTNIFGQQYRGWCLN